MIEGHSEQILRCLHSQRPAMVDLLQQLVRAESPSLVPESQDPLFGLLSHQLEAIGFVWRRLAGRSSGGLLYARPPKRAKGQATQLLLGHTDTVWPLGTLLEMPVQVDGNIVRGPGVYDMKGGLVQVIFALKTLHDLQLRPSVMPLVLFNSDEEIGSRDSRSWICRLACQSNRVLVLEPSLGREGKLKTARKGVMRFNVTAHGRAAHAGLAPEEGISAILELSYVIQKLFALNDPGSGVTVNVGSVDGGLRPNVVAPECSAQVDVRVPTQALGEQVRKAILAIEPVVPGSSIVVEELDAVPPMERTARNQRLWHKARHLGQELGLELEEGTSGGGSDGNTTSQCTATLDGLGAVGDGAHARHEYVELDKLVERCALLALLVLAPPV